MCFRPRRISANIMKPSTTIMSAPSPPATQTMYQKGARSLNIDLPMTDGDRHVRSVQLNATKERLGLHLERVLIHANAERSEICVSVDATGRADHWVIEREPGQGVLTAGRRGNDRSVWRYVVLNLNCLEHFPLQPKHGTTVRLQCAPVAIDASIATGYPSERQTSDITATDVVAGQPHNDNSTTEGATC